MLLTKLKGNSIAEEAYRNPEAYGEVYGNLCPSESQVLPTNTPGCNNAAAFFLELVTYTCRLGRAGPCEEVEWFQLQSMFLWHWP
jgi:hypothetical protein